VIGLSYEPEFDAVKTLVAVAAMVVVALSALIIMVLVFVIAVVFMVPVAFVHSPALLVVVVVGVCPVAAFIRRAIPASVDPDVATALNSPVAINPLVAFARGIGTALVANGGRIPADVDADLSKGWYRESGHHCCGG
jgi:hypothetical protein